MLQWSFHCRSCLWRGRRRKHFVTFILGVFFQSLQTENWNINLTCLSILRCFFTTIAATTFDFFYQMLFFFLGGGGGQKLPVYPLKKNTKRKAYVLERSQKKGQIVRKENKTEKVFKIAFWNWDTKELKQKKTGNKYEFRGDFFSIFQKERAASFLATPNAKFTFRNLFWSKRFSTNILTGMKYIFYLL